MAEKHVIAKLAGIQLSINPLIFGGTAILWLLFSGLVYWVLAPPLPLTLLIGLLSTVSYWLANLGHHLGHAIAARRTGYPMAGIRLGSLLFLATSRYPKDEGELPAAVHIRRALGGPIFSFILAVASGGIALLLAPGGIGWWLALCFSLINLIVYTAGALLPLGFTDGSTLLEWWPKR